MVHHPVTFLFCCFFLGGRRALTVAHYATQVDLVLKIPLLQPFRHFLITNHVFIMNHEINILYVNWIVCFFYDLFFVFLFLSILVFLNCFSFLALRNISILFYLLHIF
jgi:hypothetical protein